MFRFAHIEYLYLLFILPVLAVLFIAVYYQQRKKLSSFAGEKLHKVLFPLRSGFKLWSKFIIYIVAVGLLIMGIANPQIGSKVEEVKNVGIDVFILLDVSLSMQAEDIKPSRLEKAKFEISRLIKKLRGDRIGLIVFSGNAYVQIPLTTDYSAADLFLSAVDVSSVPQPGTDIGKAMELAMQSFKLDSETKKAIIVITDGEDHEGNLDVPIKNAVDNGIQVFTIGFGSTSGVPIPVYNASGVRTGYKKDRQGEVVLTKLGETMLMDIADKGNGEYYHATNTSDELNKIYNDLSSIEETEFGATRVTEYEDRFYWFIVPALVLLLLDVLISLNKSRFIMKFDGE